jgi:hypothetical protein
MKLRWRGQGGKVTTNSARERVTVLPLHLFSRDAVGSTSRAKQASQIFTVSPKPVRHVHSTGPNRPAERTYQKRTEGNGRWRSPPWRTRSSRELQSWYSTLSTRKTSSGSRIRDRLPSRHALQNALGILGRRNVAAHNESNLHEGSTHGFIV